MKAEELQRAADRFYSGLKEVWVPQTKQPVHLKSSDGAYTFTYSKSVMARWSEYIQKLLNVPGDIEPEALENIQKRSVNTALDEKPTRDEMVRTIKGLKGVDRIPADIWIYWEPICPTDCTDGLPQYGRNNMYHKPGRMPAE